MVNLRHKTDTKLSTLQNFPWTNSPLGRPIFIGCSDWSSIVLPPYVPWVLLVTAMNAKKAEGGRLNGWTWMRLKQRIAEIHEFSNRQDARWPRKCRHPKIGWSSHWPFWRVSWVVTGASIMSRNQGKAGRTHSGTCGTIWSLRPKPQPSNHQTRGLFRRKVAENGPFEFRRSWEVGRV